MKKLLSGMLALAIFLVLTACAAKAPVQGEPAAGANTQTGAAEQLPKAPMAENKPEIAASEEMASAETPDETPDEEPESEGGKLLVAYFSATGNTEKIARYLEEVLGVDLYAIVPQQPYTSDDLNYTAADCRAEQESLDPDARPAISGSVDNMDAYDIVFIGYPIWWGQAPKIMYTFLESYDFSGKTIVPFCTSGSSGIGGSISGLQALVSDVTWLDGQRFSGSASRADVQSWVDGLDFAK